MRGFISDHDAEIIDIQESQVVLCVDDQFLPMQRRQSDRPMSLMIELELQQDQSPGESDIATSTLIDVTIRTKRSRDRRHDSGARADQLLHSLKSYLIAEEC